MKITDGDTPHAKTLLSALRRGKWELEGEEILAFAQAFHWASELPQRFRDSMAVETVNASPPSAPVAPAVGGSRASSDKLQSRRSR